jgi:hypothetical protein
MQMGVLNYSAAARYIQEEVESLIRRDIELNTIVATLTRIAKVMDELPVIDRQMVFHRSRVYLTTGITQIQIDAGKKDQREIIDTLAESQLADIDNLSIHQFPSCIRILSSSEDAEVIRDAFAKKYSMTEKSGCALLNMKLQSTVDDDSASIAYTIDLLDRNGINILASYSVHDDILLVVEEKDISRAFELLQLASKALA